MKKLLVILVCTVFLVGNSNTFAQELPRSASFGASVGDLNDSIQAALKLPSGEGTLIKLVVPGSSAEKAGFMVNDVLVSMDGEEIQNTDQFLKMLKKHQGGDRVKINYYRKSKHKNVQLVLLPDTTDE